MPLGAWRRRTKIVCTLGPSTESEQVLSSLVDAGMNVARFNLSHGDHATHARRLETLRRVVGAKPESTYVGVLFDGKGPEVRLGRLRGGVIHLRAGARFVLTVEELLGDEGKAHVTHAGLPGDVTPGDTVLLDDGKIALTVLHVGSDFVECRVENEGEVREGKKVSVPGKLLSLPAVSERDVEDLKFSASNGVDFYAISFVRSADDVLEVRRILEGVGARIQLVAKIETAAAWENIDSILKVSDGIMVARGDLGVEIPAEEVPLAQKSIIEKCNRLGKPVITATQMLESMVDRPSPTRAEASDVANAILDGTDAVMLSAETALGRYPVEAVRVMDRIAVKVESSARYEEVLARRRPGWGGANTVTDAVSYATCSIAQSLGAKAILTPTESGYTARMVAKYRPRAPVVACTPDEAVCRRLSVVWGVIPLKTCPGANTDETFSNSVKAALAAGAINGGDLIVVTSGVPVGIPGTTNMIRVHTVGDIIVRGVGVGQKAATGRACVVRSALDASEKFREGDILVAPSTDKEYVPFLEKASAVVAEEGGLTSHAAIVGLSLGIPAIVGAEGATGMIPDGSIITVDSARGLVYRGEASIPA